MKYIMNFLKGVAIGLATLVPGVSGGTMAVILGVYDDLIHAIGSFFEDSKKHAVLLLELGAGAFTALLLFSKLIEAALKNYHFPMSFLFIGVICGGVPVLYKKSRQQERKRNDIIFLIIGFVLVLAMTVEPSATTALATAKGAVSIVFLFIAGIVIAVALILPGISGSFMLLTLGLYQITLRAINERNIPFLIPIGFGAIVGTLATTKAIEKLLQKYPGKTYMLILGFVIGSLIPVFPGMPRGINILTSIMAFIIGFAFIFWLGKKEIT
ncbi:DUF368 domain-containing protein [Clostridium oryzae]|uniref:DUF368 domain-containing protein n=1 Tax=Clostridium oryzae TaxID=1450648 RepID=A0A1V4I9S6_9CLOT|nr:DUF368 domain-containing protein [Clostridium oryzae]OPJ56673.1 hypothetical protein CLORY_42260 [Clostridium oryzae]